MKKSDLKLSLNEKAYRRIKDRIISLQLAPGAQIDESGLAQELDMGRTPIREAILRLVGEGLVESLPGRGHSVKTVSLNDVKALFEALLIAERAASFLAAQRISPQEISQLKEVNQDLKEAMARRDYLAVTRLNSRLHRIVYQAARNPYLFSSLNFIQGLSQRLAYLCFMNQGDARELDAHNQLVSRDHDRFIELLENGDGTALVELVTRHVDLFHRRVSEYTHPGDSALDKLLP